MINIVNEEGHDIDTNLAIGISTLTVRHSRYLKRAYSCTAATDTSVDSDTVNIAIRKGKLQHTIVNVCRYIIIIIIIIIIIMCIHALLVDCIYAGQHIC